MLPQNKNKEHLKTKPRNVVLLTKTSQNTGFSCFRPKNLPNINDTPRAAADARASLLLLVVVVVVLVLVIHLIVLVVVVVVGIGALGFFVRLQFFVLRRPKSSVLAAFPCLRVLNISKFTMFPLFLFRVFAIPGLCDCWKPPYIRRFLASGQRGVWGWGNSSVIELPSKDLIRSLFRFSMVDCNVVNG